MSVPIAVGRYINMVIKTIIDLFKQKSRENDRHHLAIRILDRTYRYDCVCTTVLSVRDVRRPGPVETATYVYFRHVRAKVVAHRTAAGIFGMTESRRHSFLVQSCCTKKQARTSPPASKPAAYSSIARFQPRTLNKQGIDRASVHQLAIRLRSNSHSRIVQKNPGKLREFIRKIFVHLRSLIFLIRYSRILLKKYCYVFGHTE